MFLGGKLKKVELYVPTVNDLWFRQELLSDPATMSYNAGEDVNYSGYHPGTGCIDFPKSVWVNFEKKLKDPNFFYAYIKDEETQKFVGNVHFRLDEQTKKASIDIVVKAEFRGQGYMKPSLMLLFEVAKAKGVKYLTDTLEESREVALKGFYELGFKRVKEFHTQKQGKTITIVQIEKKL